MICVCVCVCVCVCMLSHTHTHTHTYMLSSDLFLLHYCFTFLWPQMLQSCFTPVVLILYLYIYMYMYILLLTSSFTYNIHIYNIGIYSCLEICRTKACHIKALWDSTNAPGARVWRVSWTKACHSQALLRHLALGFTGVARLKLVANALLLLYIASLYKGPALVFTRVARLKPYSFSTRTLLVLFLLCVCVCVCRLTGLVECVQHSEGLRRDGACNHTVLCCSRAQLVEHR
jgi:hypothetical protein